MKRLLALILILSASAIAQLTTAQYNNARTGANLHETTLQPATVNASSFGKIGTLKVDGNVYAQPLYLPAVEISGRRRNLLYVATEHDTVYAFDADLRQPTPVWKSRLIDENSGASTLSPRDVSCPFIQPEIGITSTPVIDTATGTIYALARSKERNRYVQRLHALDVSTGAEKFGGPVEIEASVSGRTRVGSGQIHFDPLRENQRAALLQVDGKVYIAWASSCDVGPYYGWVMAYDAATLKQAGVFNTAPDNGDTGIWQSDAGPAADEQGNVYVVTGNGIFNAMSGGRDYGDSVIKIAFRNGALTVADYFTPSNQATLNRDDLDLGSQGPVLLPATKGSKTQAVVLGGKGNGVYLLNADKLGKFQKDTNNANALQVLKNVGGCLGAAAYWNQHVFLFCSNDVLKDFKWENGRLSDNPVAMGTLKIEDPGATPTVSANGTHDGIVWLVETTNWHGWEKTAILHAYDANDIKHELFNSNSSRDTAGKALRFVMPTVMNGRVYIGTKGQVDVYGLLAAK